MRVEGTEEYDETPRSGRDVKLAHISRIQPEELRSEQLGNLSQDGKWPLVTLACKDIP
jgi:hypothetical protein